MATRKSARKGGKKVAKQVVKKAAKKAVKRPAASAPPQGAAAKARLGTITHTEFASADPAATQRWCEKALGWKFAPAMPTPTGPYRMWRFASGTGGGIRTNNPPETPGSIPYLEVANIKATFAKALAAGAKAMMGPDPLPGGMGWIAVVAAPGGVVIGFWAAS